MILDGWSIVKIGLNIELWWVCVYKLVFLMETNEFDISGAVSTIHSGYIDIFVIKGYKTLFSNLAIGGTS